MCLIWAFFFPSLSFLLEFQKALIKNTKKNAYRLECVCVFLFSPVFRHIYRLYRIFVSLTELTIHKFIRIVRSQEPSHKYHNGLHCFLHRTEMGENYHLIWNLNFIIKNDKARDASVVRILGMIPLCWAGVGIERMRYSSLSRRWCHRIYRNFQLVENDTECERYMPRHRAPPHTEQMLWRLNCRFYYNIVHVWVVVAAAVFFFYFSVASTSLFHFQVFVDGCSVAGAAPNINSTWSGRFLTNIILHTRSTCSENNDTIK